MALLSSGRILTLLILACITVISAFLYFSSEYCRRIKRSKKEKVLKKSNKDLIAYSGISKHPSEYSGLFEKTYLLSLGNTHDAEALVSEWFYRANSQKGSPEYSIILAEMCSGSEWWDENDYISFASDLISGIINCGFSRSIETPHTWSVNGVTVE